ncbi:864_t:CDS:2, partial [Funneliformis caledonium]
DIVTLDDGESTEDEVEVGWINDQIENDAEQLFSVLIKNMKKFKPSKRPLNRQTIYQMLSISDYVSYCNNPKCNSNDSSNDNFYSGSYNGSGGDSDGDSYNSSGGDFDGDFSVPSNSYDGNLDHDFNSDFNKTDIFIRYTMAIENKLKIEDKHLTPGHKLRLKAVQYYLQLLDKGYAKLEASQIIADLFNRGKWFSHCVKSWFKAFINYNDVPKINHGKHFKGSSIIDDENVQLKVAVYLRQHKFDITVNNFRDYVTNEIYLSLA